MPRSFAMVSIARKDIGGHSPASFDRKFLRISNPFEDDRLSHWTGYSTPGTIPLAVYSLDYPGVPFLLIDLRRGSGPKRSEMARRVADDVTIGALGLTGFGNWDYLALKSGWMFVQKRHGRPTNRAERQRAFAQLRHALGTDSALDPALRRELTTRVERLALDPVERTWSQEVSGAWRQYEALVQSREKLDAMVKASLKEPEPGQ